MLKPGGTFVAKVFQSGADATLMTQLKRDFATVKHVKPAASRKDSSERYVLAIGFRGTPPAASACDSRQAEDVLLSTAGQLSCDLIARFSGRVMHKILN